MVGLALPAVLDAKLNGEGAIAAWCRKWRVAELALFGSALRSDFGPQSDFDFVALFESGARPGLFALIDAEDELSRILGRPVDLLDRVSVERDENYLRRGHILSSIRAIYASRES